MSPSGKGIDRNQENKRSRSQAELTLIPAVMKNRRVNCEEMMKNDGVATILHRSRNRKRLTQPLARGDSCTLRSQLCDFNSTVNVVPFPSRLETETVPSQNLDEMLDDRQSQPGPPSSRDRARSTR